MRNVPNGPHCIRYNVKNIHIYHINSKNYIIGPIFNFLNSKISGIIFRFKSVGNRSKQVEATVHNINHNRHTPTFLLQLLLKVSYRKKNN